VVAEAREVGGLILPHGGNGQARGRTFVREPYAGDLFDDEDILPL
jgi:hypothetical protein